MAELTEQLFEVIVASCLSAEAATCCALIENGIGPATTEGIIKSRQEAMDRLRGNRSLESIPTWADARLYLEDTFSLCLAMLKKKEEES